MPDSRDRMLHDEAANALRDAGLFLGIREHQEKAVDAVLAVAARHIEALMNEMWGDDFATATKDRILALLRGPGGEAGRAG